MTDKRICPHCGSEQFMAFVKRGCIVQSDGLDENNKPKFAIIKEGAKENYEIELFKCAKCGVELKAEDLIAGAKCSKCGKPVNPDELDENGMCSVCAMLKDNPDLEHASTEDLLRLLAEARKNANPVKSKIAAKEQKAQEIENKVAENAALTDDINDILGEEQPPVQEATPKRGRRPKAQKKRVTEEQNEESQKVDNAADTTAEESHDNPVDAMPEDTSSQEQIEEQTTEQAEAEQIITENQAAPFPEVSNDMNTGCVPPPSDEEMAEPNGKFQMFDEEDEDQPF